MADNSSKTRVVQLGTRKFDFPSSSLQELQDSNHLLGDREALKRQINNTGYLLIRGLHDRDEVLAARLAVLKHIQGLGEDKLSTDHPLEEGVLNPRCGLGCVPFMEGKNNITHSGPLLRVLEGSRPMQFFHTLFGEEPRTFDFKWLRAMHHEGYTGAHVDNVYMCRGTDQVYTMWTPIGDVSIEMGTLAVCEGSHRLPSFDHFHKTYGNFDVEKQNLQGTGWFTCDPWEISKLGGQWKTTDFKAGDVLIFTLRTVHMSTTNTTNYARISCDTRWQPSSHSIDPRYVGAIGETEPKFGVFGKEDLKQKHSVTMEEMKKKWGFS